MTNSPDKLDERLPIALYYQLKQIVINKIEANEWTQNSKIPTEYELAEYYKVSRATVRQALKALVDEGYLYRKQGKGTFVLAPKIDKQLHLFYSFSDEMRKLGYTPTTSVLAFDLIEADENIRKKLTLADDLRVFRITRLRLADMEPFAVETSYLPYKYYAGLTRKSVEEFGLYTTMKNLSGFSHDTATETFEAVLLSPSEAKLLKVKRPAAGLYFERFSYYGESAIVEYCKAIVRGDRYKYSISLG